jgi:acyl carrier protein
MTKEVGMTRQIGLDIRGELDDIVVRAAGVSQATLATAGDQPLVDLGLDSLAALELQSITQARYGVRIPDESLEMSLPQIAHFVSTRLTEEA